MTNRKYPGFVFCPADLPQSAYGMGLVALSSVKIEVMAGLSLDTSTLRIRLSFIPVSYTHLDVYKRQAFQPVTWVFFYDF